MTTSTELNKSAVWADERLGCKYYSDRLLVNGKEDRLIGWTLVGDEVVIDTENGLEINIGSDIEGEVDWRIHMLEHEDGPFQIDPSAEDDETPQAGLERLEEYMDGCTESCLYSGGEGRVVGGDDAMVGELVSVDFYGDPAVGAPPNIWVQIGHEVREENTRDMVQGLIGEEVREEEAREIMPGSATARLFHNPFASSQPRHGHGAAPDVAARPAQQSRGPSPE